jgi:thiol:disulfide interchange protein
MQFKLSRNIIVITVLMLSILACNAANLTQPSQDVPIAVHQEQPDATEIPIITPYDEKAIPQNDIDAALRLAKGDGKLVLLDFGANWCADCIVLATLFEDPSVKPYLDENFYVVHIDVGYWDKNLDTSQLYNNPIEKGIPAVVILTGDGQTIATTKDGALANASKATASEILGYLKDWVAKKP